MYLCPITMELIVHYSYFPLDLLHQVFYVMLCFRLDYKFTMHFAAYSMLVIISFVVKRIMLKVDSMKKFEEKFAHMIKHSNSFHLLLCFKLLIKHQKFTYYICENLVLTYELFKKTVP